jgi:hypothetical protein
MLADQPPAYLVDPTAEDVGLGFADYRNLCKHCLIIYRQVSDGVMGIHRTGETVAVDIWTKQGGCLTVSINNQSQTLHLHYAILDAPTMPLRFYSGDLSSASWSKLQQIALAY